MRSVRLAIPQLATPPRRRHPRAPFTMFPGRSPALGNRSAATDSSADGAAPSSGAIVAGSRRRKACICSRNRRSGISGGGEGSRSSITAPISPARRARSTVSPARWRRPARHRLLLCAEPRRAGRGDRSRLCRFAAVPCPALARKLALRLNENNIGYLPVNASVQGASTVHKATRPNQNESFFISHDRGPDHPDVVAGKPLRGRNQWPAGMPGMRADMMAYFDALGAMCDRMLPAFAVALDMPADFFAPLFRRRGARHPALSALSAAGHGRGQLFRPGAAHRQQLYDRAGAHRRAGPGGAAAVRRVVSAADHPRHLSDQSRQHHAALVERPLSVDAARRAQRFGHRPLFDRLFPQPEPGPRHRMPADLRRRRQPGALSAGGLPRSRARILSGQLFPPERPPLRGRGAAGE